MKNERTITDQRVYSTPPIEECATPEEFIRALRAQADKCNEAYSELQSAWQDRNAGKFWSVAARKLELAADALEKLI